MDSQCVISITLHNIHYCYDRGAMQTMHRPSSIDRIGQCNDMRMMYQDGTGEGVLRFGPVGC